MVIKLTSPLSPFSSSINKYSLVIWTVYVYHVVSKLFAHKKFKSSVRNSQDLIGRIECDVITKRSYSTKHAHSSYTNSCALLCALGKMSITQVVDLDKLQRTFYTWQEVSIANIIIIQEFCAFIDNNYTHVIATINTMAMKINSNHYVSFIYC